MDYRREALSLIKSGISVIPVKTDGSKLPKIKWKEYQDRVMTESEVNFFFEDCGGVIAITGSISNLLCIDFDLDKQRETDDFWALFMSKVPNEMKQKMLVNRTRSGGFHVWVLTDYEDKSRKVTHRPLTIPELTERYSKLIENGANEETASLILLKKPVECIIETRSKGSYGVFIHPQYTRFYGDKLNWFTKEEVEFLLDIGYSLDYNYRKPPVFEGDKTSYKLVAKYNDDAKAKDVLRIVEESGLFSLYDIDSNGNYRLSRVGSPSPFSAYIYGDTGVFHIFGLNPFSDNDKTTYTPFEVTCAVKGLTKEECIKTLQSFYNEGKEI